MYSFRIVLKQSNWWRWRCKYYSVFNQSIKQTTNQPIH